MFKTASIRSTGQTFARSDPFVFSQELQDRPFPYIACPSNSLMPKSRQAVAGHGSFPWNFQKTQLTDIGRSKRTAYRKTQPGPVKIPDQQPLLRSTLSGWESLPDNTASPDPPFFPTARTEHHAHYTHKYGKATPGRQGSETRSHLGKTRLFR